MTLFRTVMGFLLFILISNSAWAARLPRYSCSLLKVGGGELENFILLPQKEIHQFVTPQLKFFMDLKKAMLEVEVPAPVSADPHAPPAKPNKVLKKGLRLTISLYSDFTAHFGAAEGLVEKKSGEFGEQEQELVVKVQNISASPPESYVLKCSRLVDIDLRKLLKRK